MPNRQRLGLPKASNNRLLLAEAPQTELHATCHWCAGAILQVWTSGGWSPWFHWNDVRRSIFCRLDAHRNYHPGVVNEASPKE